LEGPMAAGIDRKGNTVPDPGASYDRVVYTAYPRFNYHPSLAQSLVDSGVDVVSTANNHALDREAIGVDKTLDALDEVKLAHTGTRRQGASERAPWHAITSAGDVRVAWLACAHTTNQIADEHHQVLHCYKDRALVLRLVRELARDPKIAAVIVTPHWGREYQTEPRKQEVKLAHELAEAGATAILGSHPHVLQPWERHTTQDGREVFIHYSLGNFASHQPELPRRSTVILYLALGVHEGRARVRGVGYVPLHVRQDGEQFFTEAIDRVDGPADSRALTVELLGRENLLAPDAPLSLAPHCQPGHRFPAP
ncbi:MAG: CapA family protein, partial [Myxococcales bacterium]|nr:CapA family protein [Myxococcales bacterium]